MKTAEKGTRCLALAAIALAANACGSNVASDGASVFAITNAAQAGPDPTPSSAASPGPYKVARYSSGIPADSSYGGWDVDYASNAPAVLPGVALIPGFFEPRSAVQKWAPFLASHGFAVITIDPVTGLDLPSVRATALWAAIEDLKAENTRAGSPLRGKLDVTHMAVMGHSMGGGGTLIAATAHADLKAAVALCPWNLDANFSADTTPTLIFGGQSDRVAPVGIEATVFYNAIPATTSKTYAELANGDHWAADDPTTNAAVARLGLSWLEAFVAGDSRYRQFLKNDPALSTFASSSL